MRERRAQRGTTVSMATRCPKCGLVLEERSITERESVSLWWALLHPAVSLALSQRGWGRVCWFCLSDRGWHILHSSSLSGRSIFICTTAGKLHIVKSCKTQLRFTHPSRWCSSLSPSLQEILTSAITSVNEVTPLDVLHIFEIAVQVCTVFPELNRDV